MIAFALPIFAGAFLLFQVQPLIAEFILPWFGGAPAVWTTCMLFSQTCLLAGYAYAHVTVRYLMARRQAVLHAALLLAALACLPIVPGAQWKPHPTDEPTWRILLLLTACLGLPYFVLSSTSPLLQAWFSRLHPGVSPYRLYALSNVGSLLALVSYPFVFEPALTRQTQASVWAWGFGAFVLLCGACGWNLWKSEGRGTKAEGRRQNPISPRTHHVSRFTLHLPSTPQPAALVPLSPVRFGVVAGHDQQALPTGGGGALPLGSASKPISGDLHSLLRPPGVVCAPNLHGAAHCDAGVAVLDDGRGPADVPASANHPILQRPLRLLHGLPRGSLSPETVAAFPYFILPVNCRGRSGRRPVGRAGRPAGIQFLRRTPVRLVAFGRAGLLGSCP